MQHLNKYRLAYGWALFIFILCTANPSSFPDIPFEFTFGKDKIAHFALFGFQALFIILANLGSNNFKYYISAFFISSVYGVSIEIIQGLFFANRSFDYADMLANTIGAAFVVSFFGTYRLVKQL
ncbi:MAG: VanZ family protein [Bacteroidia bacterium]